MIKVFIDGSAGTTGLRIHERLAARADLTLLTLPEELRKDSAARSEMLHEANVAFLCLPDAAAIEAVALAGESSVRIIDTSTAHRTNPAWAYGFAELARREQIANAKLVANPGCHASGFLALVTPLVKAGLLDRSVALTAYSITGYSGGGKKMIADYEAAERDTLLGAPRQYGLAQTHKHLPEMCAIAGLETAPCFAPIVADFYSGMEVSVPLFAKDLRGTVENVREIYAAAYNTPVVHYSEQADEGGFLSAAALSGRDDMEISVAGNADRILLTARYDNLGKGASGAAIQNMNIMLGVDETLGLILN